MNKLIATNNIYREFFIHKMYEWQALGRLYSITGCFKTESRRHRDIWDYKYRNLKYFFNRYQREFTGARHWNKALCYAKHHQKP